MPKIALVDDEQSILTSVSLSLQSEGFTVDTFLNGVEALEALESKSYDLGLFDVKKIIGRSFKFSILLERTFERSSFPSILGILISNNPKS